MDTIKSFQPVEILEQHIKHPQYSTIKKQVFIIGSKGIPANYGGFETFVEKLTQYQKNLNICYHVAGIANNTSRYEYNNAKCFNIKVPNIGPAKAIYYDIAALKQCIAYCKSRPAIKNPIFYILACRIGPFIKYYKKQIVKMGGLLYVNPDGHEWRRAKWSAPVREYWKLSERMMVKYADLLICDSKNIESYIQDVYQRYDPQTTYIAYGAETEKSALADDDTKLMDWYAKYDLAAKKYYLVVGRFVPENNYEIMIREFMKTKTEKDFVLITKVSQKFLKKLKRATGFDKDKRIKFVGTVFEQELLKKIRENAYAYLHGHEVGGTNPSLLEALSSTDLNLLLDVSFNREVGENAALYWTKEEGSLARLMEKVDGMKASSFDCIGACARKRISDTYSWANITDRYEGLFLSKKG